MSDKTYEDHNANRDTLRVGRRKALKTIAIAGGTVFTASTLGPFVSFVPAAMAAPTAQKGWAWCSKCEGMFYDKDSQGKGHCPAGGAHTDVGSGHYFQIVGETAVGQQGGWRWCKNCEGMFYSKAKGNHMGVCPAPAGGKHVETGSGHYAIKTGTVASAGVQTGWKWCPKCMGLFSEASSTGTHMGVCPAGGTHTAGSGNYVQLS